MTPAETIAKQILDGNLVLPTINGLDTITTVAQRKEIHAMFRALWHTYLLKGIGAPVSTPYWIKRIGDITVANTVIKVLSENNWIVSKSLPNNNWAEMYLNNEKLLTYVSADQLVSVRRFNKFKKYMPNHSESTQAIKTRLGSESLDTGLVREGFMATGNSEYCYDTVMMEQYKDLVVPMITKGIDKMITKHPKIKGDLANYHYASEEIVDALIAEAGTYTGGNRTNDPRGRNNRGDLDKIGNPVGFKIMRSLLQIPEHKRNTITTEGLNNAFLFIAEIHGTKNVTRQQKLVAGQQHYLNRNYVYPDEIKDSYEDIWLERLYNDIDKSLPINGAMRIMRSKYLNGKLTIAKYMELRYTYISDFKWTVFIEIDMSASVLGFCGLLLGHQPFIQRCNMIGDVLGDAWAHPVITNRVQFKTIMR